MTEALVNVFEYSFSFLVFYLLCFRILLGSIVFNKLSEHSI